MASFLAFANVALGRRYWLDVVCMLTGVWVHGGWTSRAVVASGRRLVYLDLLHSNLELLIPYMYLEMRRSTFFQRLRPTSTWYRRDVLPTHA